MFPLVVYQGQEENVEMLLILCGGTKWNRGKSGRQLLQARFLGDVKESVFFPQEYEKESYF